MGPKEPLRELWASGGWHCVKLLGKGYWNGMAIDQGGLWSWLLTFYEGKA